MPRVPVALLLALLLAAPASAQSDGEAGAAYVFERDGTDWSLAQ